MLTTNKRSVILFIQTFVRRSLMKMTKSEFKSLLSLFAVTLMLVLIYSFSQNQENLFENTYSANNVESNSSNIEFYQDEQSNMASANSEVNDKTGAVNVGMLPQGMSVDFANYELSVAKYIEYVRNITICARL